MDESRADILAGIRELRAKATEQLTGNQYYMISQQLDSLEQSPELTGELAHSVLNILRSRLGAAAGEAMPAQQTAAGDPEIPNTPDSPAEPSTPSTPEEPATPDSPASPQPSPMPDVPSPGTSPAEPPTPPETSQSAQSEQIITPRANSFGMPQPTVAINLSGVQQREVDEPAAQADETGSEDAAAQPVQTGLVITVNAAEKLARTQLDGNRYYMVASRLAALRNLPQADQSAGTAFEPETLDEALTLLRQEIEPLAREARDEAERIVAEIGDLLKPQAAQAAPEMQTAQPSIAPEQVAAAKAPDAEETAATVDQAEAEDEPITVAEPAEEAETAAPSEPATGFDALAEAAWRRVQEVSEGDTPAVVRLNGATPPPSAQAAVADDAPAAPQPEEVPAESEPAAMTAPEAEAPAEPELQSTAEPVSQDNQAPAAVETVIEELEPAETAQAEAEQAETAQVEAIQLAEAAPAAASPAMEESPVEPATEEKATATAIEPIPEQPDAAAPLSSQDKGEAFNDGGSERRSSEPCYAAEFVEDDVPGVSAAADAEPAREESAEPSPAGDEAADPAGEAGLSGAETMQPNTVEQEVSVGEATEPAAPSQEESIAAADRIEGGEAEEQIQDEPESLASPPAAEVNAEPEKTAAAVQQEPAGAETTSEPAPQEPAEPEAPAEAETSASPSNAETPPAGTPDAAVIAAEQKSAEPEKAPEKPARRGLFSRLFGSR